MNPTDEKTAEIDRGLLDVLVDGELPEVQRRELLRRLERTPGGWRDCALAFLEAQCLRESLGGGVSREATVRPETTVRTPVPPKRRRVWARHAGTVLAMAASFLAALAVGWWARHAGGPRSPLSDPAVNLAARQQESPVTRSPVIEQAPPATSPSPMMTVALPAVGADGRPIRLPVVEREQIDHSLLYPDTPAFPAELREALRRAGYQVRQSRELLPLPVEDGRHAIVPVDQVDIHYVGNHIE